MSFNGPAGPAPGSTHRANSQQASIFWTSSVRGACAKFNEPDEISETGKARGAGVYRLLITVPLASMPLSGALSPRKRCEYLWLVVRGPWRVAAGSV